MATSLKAMQSSTPESKVKRASRKRARGEVSDPYDAWLEHRLKSLYQPILDDPLPADMLKLLGKRKS